MESVLHRIYIGSLGPVKYYEPRSVEFWKQNEQVNAILEKWAAKLGNEDQLDIFDEMLTVYIQMSDLEREEMFQRGFNLAAKLMSEVFFENTHEAK